MIEIAITLDNSTAATVKIWRRDSHDAPDGTTQNWYDWSVTDGDTTRESNQPVHHSPSDGLLVLITNVLKAACGGDCSDHPAPCNHEPAHDARWTLESLPSGAAH